MTTTQTHLASRVVQGLLQRSWTIATGESLTAGLVAATLADIPGCSQVLRGGVVAYVPEVKTELLGVGPEVLASGIVSEPVALAMAQGAAERLGADVGVGTTGAAGPDSHDGAAPGTACIGVWTSNAQRTQTVHVSGDRAHVRLEVTRITLEAIAGFIALGTN
jgi:nicotinamide-nucleotide amidase